MSTVPRVFPFKDHSVTDNGRLETARMTLAGIVRGEADALLLVAEAATPVTVHGQRHSQGGQSLMDDGLALDLDLLQSVTVHQTGPGQATARVAAGANWDRLHRKLWAHSLAARPQYKAEEASFAPVTHQSSPHFSIGGSLAVNCHGRDPRQGPVAKSVLSLKVRTGKDATPRELRPNGTADEQALMRAVLGGYGSCAIILGAELALKPEKIVDLKYGGFTPVQAYCSHVASYMAAGQQPPFDHDYAWLSCGPQEQLMTQAVHVVGVAMPNGLGHRSEYDAELDEEGLLNDDMLSAIYHHYRMASLDDMGAQWPTLIRQIRLMSQGVKRQLNAMRAPVRFTQSQPYGLPGQTRYVDLMQEYFLPPSALGQFIDEARRILGRAQEQRLLKVLTCTTRALQQDNVSLLSYAPDGPRCSLVINFSTPWGEAHHFDQPGNPLTLAMRELIDAALALKGSYYPCYGRFATPEQFKLAFDAARVEEMKRLRRLHDPDTRFNNKFLQTYLPV